MVHSDANMSIFCIMWGSGLLTWDERKCVPETSVGLSMDVIEVLKPQAFGEMFVWAQQALKDPYVSPKLEVLPLDISDRAQDKLSKDDDRNKFKGNLSVILINEMNKTKLKKYQPLALK